MALTERAKSVANVLRDVAVQNELEDQLIRTLYQATLQNYIRHC